MANVLFMKDKEEFMFIEHICEKCGKKCEFSSFNFWSNYGFVCEDCDQELTKKGEIRYV